jgi:hypothetical protein
MIRRAVVLTLLAGAAWASLRLTPLGAPVWEARGVEALQEGSAVVAVQYLDRAVTLSPTPRRWTRLGFALVALGRKDEARRALLRGTLAREDDVRRDALHALSALYLEDAESDDPGRLPGRAVAAARAAMDGLRVEAGHQGLSWNLFLARSVGGFAEPETESARLEPSVSEALRVALRNVEARELRESVRRVLRALEETIPPRTTEGPPW